ncbi:glycoside hydrolase family 43 protein [Terriglobus aquaticus]|uniref:Glycoside hydrolase 43 family protein n=1 Tax=Terriglobus aquaticus TaxID=940139 RepID=A0ABW9KFU7_9BACT|nr:glycoside hydrolase 43 family protein [Terriglobus aquaticus]
MVARTICRTAVTLTALLVTSCGHAQRSRVSAAEQATYTNPILFSDYSDPDVVRDGKRYVLVASTFSFVPGLPILVSPDLVHWTILTHALQRVDLAPQYDMNDGDRYGGGVWAPAIRKHAGRFYIFFPTPEEGIFMVSAARLSGPWTKPVAVLAGPKLEDPCPFWDDDGKAYLVHSRTGAGPLILHRMSPDATHVLDAGKEIVNDPVHLKTLEGPKLYKRNGWYYIFAPFGGVSTGKQVTLRSRSIDGPYESQISLQQGTSNINGPHQGGWVTTPDGKDYFVHFQSRGAHGRIVHLEPMRWENDWPVMGTATIDPMAPRPGQPVQSAPVPVPVARAAKITVQTSDEFASTALGPQWEWNHNPVKDAWSLSEHRGYLRLHALPSASLFAARNTLTQQMQSESLVFTARLELTGLQPGTHAGLGIFEQKASGIEITDGGQASYRLAYFHVERAKRGTVTQLGDDAAAHVARHIQALLLRVTVRGDRVRYSFSADEGKSFQELGPETPIDFSWWKGARPALFAYSESDGSATPGYLDVDSVHVDPIP